MCRRIKEAIVGYTFYLCTYLQYVRQPDTDYISNMYVRMYVHTYLCAYSLYIMKSHNNQLQGQEAAIQVALSVANSIVRSPDETLTSLANTDQDNEAAYCNSYSMQITCLIKNCHH